MKLYHFLFQLVFELLNGRDLSTTALKSTLVLSARLLHANFPDLTYERQRRPIISGALKSNHPLNENFHFCQLLFDWPQFRIEVLPSLLNLCQTLLMKTPSETEFEEIILMLVLVVLNFSKSTDMDNGLDLTSQQGLLFFPKCASKQGEEIVKQFVHALKVEKVEKINDGSLALIWGILVCLPCIR